jgi:hypothetical protein
VAYSTWGCALSFGVALSATVGQYLGAGLRLADVGGGAVRICACPLLVHGWLIWGEMPVIWTHVGAAIIAWRSTSPIASPAHPARAPPPSPKPSETPLDEPGARLARCFGDVHGR